MYRLVSFLMLLAALLCLPQQGSSQTAQVEADKEVCTTSTTINAITPNGVWSTSGGATIVSPSSVTSNVNNLDQGTNTFTYAVNGYSPATLVVTNNTIIANANELAADACSTTATIEGSSDPVVPIGQWSLVFPNDDIVIDNTTNHTTNVSNLPFGATTFVWTVENGTCSDYDELIINKELPDNILGEDQTGCTNTFYIGASAPPSGGTGLWTDEGSTGLSFDDVASSGVQITAPVGVSTARWTITYNSCSSFKDFVITNNLPVPVAGEDFSTCTDDITLDADGLQIGESGKWTVVDPQNEVFTDTADPKTAVSGVKQGTTTFEWTVTNAFCSATDLVQVINNRPDVDAGLDDVICTSSYTLNANNPSPHMGTWTSDPTVTFNDVNQYNATISGMENDTYTLTWTVDNGDCIASDEVIITSDFVTITAGSDQTECNSTFTLTGTEIPSGGSGYWTKTFGNGIIDNSLSATTTVSNIGEISRFTWTIISGGCTYSNETQLSNQLPSQASTNPDKPVCSSVTTIIASPPVDQNEAGTWSIEGAGTANIISPSLFQTQVTNLQSGSNVFRWTIYNQNCSTYDLIEITNNEITANAGENDEICTTITNLDASLPSGTGFWTSTNTGVVFDNSTNPTTQVSNLSFGQNTFTWTRNAQGCSASDQVIITSNLPVNVFAGSDQVVCADLADLNADNPSNGTGNWTIVSGNGNIANTNLYQTEVTNLQLGSNIFRWTVTYNSCSSYADVEISNQRIVMDAGPNHTICNTASTTMAGTMPTGLQTGIWTEIGGNGVFNNQSQYNTTVDGLLIGINTFRWTLSDGVCTNFSDVTVTNDTPDAAQVGDDQIICSDHTLIGAVGVENGTGKWSVTSGSGVIANSLNNNTNVNAIGSGANTFTWTVTKNSCSRTADIVVNNNSVIANITSAGGSICNSDHATTLVADDPSAIGATGVWTKLSAGSGTIESPSNFETVISNLANGENYFRWTVQNADCSAFDAISVVNDYYTASASTVGPSAVCENYVGIIGNPAPPAGIGRWSANSGGVVFDNSTSGNTYARELPVGVTTISWTIENNGCFALTDFEVTNNSLSVSAGEDITGCEAEQTLNADALQNDETGYWVANNINVVFDNSTAPVTTARNIPMGTSFLTWTITENGCFASDDMLLTNNAFFVTAGANQTLCGTSYTLQGSDPLATGTGYWSVIQGGGEIENSNAYTTSVASLPNGDNIFRWTVTRNSCVATDEVMITNDLYIAEASAPESVCIDEVDVSATSLPAGSGADGVWTTLHGGGVFDDVNAYETTVRGLSLGSNRFRWTVTKGSCESFQNIEVMDNRVVVSAGTSKNVCDNFTELFASSLGAGETGLWTSSNPLVVISTPTNSYTQVSNLERGSTDFTWTVNNNGCVGDNTIVITNNDFDAEAGPDQEIIVNNTSMNAELPSGAVGDWTIFTGVGVFTDINDPATEVTFIGYGYNTYRWTVNWNGCISSDDMVVVYNVAKANAGSDQTSCNDYATLDANNPGLGTGTWTVESGSGTFTNPALYNTTVTNVGRGTNVYRWTVTAFEAVAYDEVSITNNAFDIYAGEDVQTCDVSVEMNAQEPETGIGTWTIIQGAGTFSNNYQYDANLTNMFVGINRYVWSVTRDGCNDKDTVEITHYQPVTAPDAGADASLCNDNKYTITANQAVYGTGVWSTDNNTVTIDLPNNYSTPVKNLPEGPTTFYWTISNEHCQAQDEVVISSWTTIEITDNPNSIELNAGETATFTVGTTGSVENYQWQKDETDLSNGGRIIGADTESLVISDLMTEDIGYYRCIVHGYCNVLESYASPLSVIALGQEDISSQNNIKIYPNPSNGIVNFEYEDAHKIDFLNIYHLSGKKVFEKTNLDNNETFDLRNLNEGTYIVVISLDNKLLNSKLIIKK
jgi:large repetitive protein